MRIRDERLPWLTDEPAVAADRPAGSDRPSKGTGRLMWPWYLLLLLLVSGVALGAWWLGTRQREAPPPQLPVEEPIAIPVPATAPPVVAEPAPSEVPGEEAQAVPDAPQRTAALAAPALPRPRPAPVRVPSVPDEAPQRSETPASGRSVFPADEPAAAPPPITGPVPLVIHHPQKYRGRVVQLGAFPTRAQADAAWRRAIRRYPYLATKPKMVNTVDVRALGGGRGTRMYRLQLGTSSQAQSAVICQQLERAGQSCVVVY
jgi:type IV secretory pathway VirB10-like protein